MPANKMKHLFCQLISNPKMSSFFLMVFMKCRINTHRCWKPQPDFWLGPNRPGCWPQWYISWSLQRLAASYTTVQTESNWFVQWKFIFGNILPCFGCQACGHGPVKPGYGRKPTLRNTGVVWLPLPAQIRARGQQGLSVDDMTCVLQSGSSCIWCWKILS